MSASPPRAYDSDFMSGRIFEVVNALGEGFAVLDGQGVVQFMNPAAAELLNVVPAETLGRKFEDFAWEITDADGSPLPRGTHPALVALSQGEAYPATVLGATSPSLDGTLWVEVSARPLIAPDGKTIEGSVALFRDVGAERAAEEALHASELRFKALSSLLAVGIFQTDASGACLYVNDAWCQMAGMEAHDALGEGWVQVVHPADRDWVLEAWQAAAEGQTMFRSEHRYRLPDGEVRWVLCQAKPPPDGLEFGYLGTVIDITDHRTAASIKDQLIGLVSHELRAPLVALQGALGHLDADATDLDEASRRLLDMAVRNASLLGRLVDRLLDIERLSVGVAPLDVEDVVLRTVAQESVDVVLAAEGEHSITVSLEGIDPDLTLPADRDRIHEVFINLLMNASKHAGMDTDVDVACAVGPEQVTVSVRDHGVGIPAELQERVFERFVQGERGDGEAAKGVGLGLSIARVIVERHGGRMWLESEEGEGSTFYFTLPVDGPTR